MLYSRIPMHKRPTEIHMPVSCVYEEGTYETTSFDENLSEESLIAHSDEHLRDVDMEGDTRITHRSLCVNESCCLKYSLRCRWRGDLRVWRSFHKAPS